jgi:hypothetical protein
LSSAATLLSSSTMSRVKKNWLSSQRVLAPALM